MTTQYLKNKSILNLDANREKALEIIETAYRALDTETIIKKNITLENDIISIGHKKYNAKEYENIYVIGFGKLSCQAAKTLEDILGPLIKQGVVIGMTDSICQIVSTYTGTHPTPSSDNIKATEKIIQLGEMVTEKDLVIVVVSGGGSSLLCADKKEAEQHQKLYKNFLQTGGNIFELNTVRKHTSSLKGGGLAKLLYPAEVVSLIFCDVPGNKYEYVASGPTYKDESTNKDAEAIINKYQLGDFDLSETPKDEKYFARVTNLPLAGSILALEAMAEKAREIGLNPKIIGDDITSDIRETAELFMQKATEAEIILAGGEISVSVPPNTNGQGGRCSTLTLTMLEKINDRQIFVALASDGYDNTDSAGAIVDKHTKEKALNNQLDSKKFLENFDAYNFFKQTGDLLETGRIESNVSDLMFLITFK